MRNIASFLLHMLKNTVIVVLGIQTQSSRIVAKEFTLSAIRYCSNILFKMSHTQLLQQINVKNVHPVNGAGIQTHDLWNMSLLQ